MTLYNCYCICLPVTHSFWSAHFTFLFSPHLPHPSQLIPLTILSIQIPPPCHIHFFLPPTLLRLLSTSICYLCYLPLAENCNYFALSSTWFFYFYLLAFVFRSRMYKIYVTSRSFQNSKHAQNYMDNFYLFYMCEEKETTFFVHLQVYFIE